MSSFNQSTGSVRRMRASDWVKVSSSKGPWVPPPAKSTKSRMSWEVIIVIYIYIYIYIYNIL